MKFIDKCLSKAMVILIVLSLFSGYPGFAQPVTTTITDGWLTDFDGRLFKDQDGYYVFTITSAMVKANKVEVNLNKFAALFLNDFRDVSNTQVNKKLKIVNKTGKVLVYEDYTFTTENTLPRTNNIFAPEQGAFRTGLDSALGSAYTAMLSTITSPTYRTDLCLNVKGFDGKNINIMLANLRCVNDPVTAFYGVADTFDVSLPQMMNLDANLKRAGYSGYADYLKRYYGVANLSQLKPEAAYNILGTTNGAQSAITHWKDNSIEGKAIPASEVGRLTNQFRIWGILSLNGDAEDRAEYPYVPNYFMMETDPEVLQFAYDYLYTHGLRFSFDFKKYPFDTTDSERGRGGFLGVKSYVQKNALSNEAVRDSLGNERLNNGNVIKLDHVSAGLYVPNAWNQYRLYDYGFSLHFRVDQGLIPKTGDDTQLLLLGVSFLVSVLAAGWIILFFWKQKKRKDADEHE